MEVYALDGERIATANVALIMPTSLCSSQVVDGMVSELQDSLAFPGLRFIGLRHTEGCGAGYSHETREMQDRIFVGTLTHPNVRIALNLEHGCEKNHNSALMTTLRKRGEDPGRFGYASVQLDGGLVKVKKVRNFLLELSRGER